MTLNKTPSSPQENIGSLNVLNAAWQTLCSIKSKTGYIYFILLYI